MFTSRAEHRLVLRQDNVFMRLMPYAHELGTVSKDLYERFLQEKILIEKSVSYIKRQKPHGKAFKAFHDIEFMKKVKQSGIESKAFSSRALLSIHAQIRYDGYIEKEIKEIKKTEKFQKLEIPNEFEFNNIPGLTRELQEKLSFHRPKNIAQAHLIPGMTPAAISLLIFQVRRKI